jgi:hypothetical protein
MLADLLYGTLETTQVEGFSSMDPSVKALGNQLDQHASLPRIQYIRSSMTESDRPTYLLQYFGGLLY